MRPTIRARLAVVAATMAATLATGLYKASHEYGKTGSDFGYLWYAARVLWHGCDPYAAVHRGVWYFDNGFMYPLGAAVLVLPSITVPSYVAAVLFSALSMGALAWALTRDSWDRWPLLMSWPCLMAVGAGQWSPLVTTAALLPAFGFAASCKPTLGLAAFAYRPSWRFIASGLVLPLLAFAFMPDWPLRWIEATRHATENNYHIPLLQTGGFLLPLALVKWRRPEARLLFVMSLVPQTMLVYDQLALGLIAKGRIQTYWFALLSYLIPWSAAFMWFAPVNPTKGESFRFLAHVITVGFYLPCLVIVLRRPNEAD